MLDADGSGDLSTHEFQAALKNLVLPRAFAVASRQDDSEI